MMFIVVWMMFNVACHRSMRSQVMVENAVCEKTKKKCALGKTGRGAGVGDQWVKRGDGNWEIYCHFHY